VIWPSGRKDLIGDVNANQSISIEEGKGIVATQPIVFAMP